MSLICWRQGRGEKHVLGVEDTVCFLFNYSATQQNSNYNKGIIMIIVNSLYI